MNRHQSLFLKSLVAFCATFFLFTALSQAATYYVSPSGSDSNSGTSTTTPWQSISKVNSASLIAGDSVLFNKGGTYYGNLNITRSGSMSAPITFSSYGSGANPVISGGTDVSGWTSSGGGIYEAPLATEPKIVTIAGTQYAVGRFPDSGWLTMDSTNGSSSLTSSGLSGQTGLAGAQVVIKMNRSIITKHAITSQSGNTINFIYDGYGTQQGYGFFITNKLSTLTKYGEWFYDASTHKLKVYTGGSAPTGVVASTLSQLVTITGRTDIVFNGLDFLYSNDAMVEIQNSDRITFTNGNFKFVGDIGIVVGGNGAQHLSVTNSNFSYVDNDGIRLYGGNNDGLLINNNTFRDMGMIPGEGGSNGYRAISLENGASINAVISNNIIDRVGYIGISGGSKNSLVKNNIISNFCLLMDDGAGIYVQSRDGSLGKRVTGNIVFNGGMGSDQGTDQPGENQAHGLYSDGGNTNTEFDNNTVFNVSAGFFMDDGTGINVHDNTFYDNINNMDIEYFARDLQITGLQVKNNISVVNDTNSTAFIAQSQAPNSPSLSTWGTIDYNYFARPLNDTDTIYTYNGSGNGQHLTLAQWRPLYGYDMHSQKSPIALTSANDIRFEYNPTASLKTVSLGANYIDVKNVSYPGSITLAPYASAVLLRTSGTPTGDTTAPSVPTNLSGAASSQTQINLNWSPSTDNVGVTGYKIYRNGAQIATATAPSYSNTSLTAGTTYSYTVSAYDAAGNNSGQSSAINVATQNATDTTAPTISLTAPSNGSTLSGITTISANASDNVGVSKVDFYQGSTLLGSDTTSPYSLSWNTATVSNGSYTLSAKAYDAAGNVGTASGSVSVNNVVTPPPTGDTTAPSIPTNLTGSASSQTQINLSWNASTDNVAVTGYKIYRNSTQVGTVTTTTFADSGLIANTTYSYTVSAYDAAGNNSGQSSAINVATQNIIITPPTGTFSLGDRVKVVGTRARVRATPSTSGTSLGLQAVGALGTIVSGPTVASGYTWWKVDYDISPDGWSIENRLQKYTVTPPPTGDTTKPAITFTDPAANSTVSGTVVVGTYATDNILVDHVDLYYENTLIFSDHTEPPVFYIDWNTVGVSNGTHTLTAKAYDAAGNVGVATMNVVVSNTVVPNNRPPVANAGADKTITLPTNSVTLTGTATDPDNNSMTYAWTKVSGGAATITTPTLLSTTVTGLVQGTYTFWLTVTDSVGASNADAVTVTVGAAVTGDTTKPVVSFTDPTVNGASLSGTYLVKMYATDNILVDHVDLYYNNTLIFSDHTDPPIFHIDWNTRTVTNGSYTLTAKAYDAAGNVGIATRTVTVSNTATPTGDTTAPAIIFTDPAANSTVSGTVVVGTYATDNILVDHVDLYYENTLIFSDHTEPPVFYIDWNTVGVSNGTHTLTAKAYDAAGNVGVATRTVVVSNGETVPPVISFTYPTTTGTVLSGISKIQMYATDNILVDHVDLYYNNTLIFSDHTDPPIFHIDWNTRSVSNGTYMITAKAYDAVGNMGSASISVTVQN